MILLSLHWSFVIYINSSYLLQFMNDTNVGLLYIIGSGLTIFFFLALPNILRRFGNYNTTLLLTLIEFVVLILMGYSHSLIAAVPLFITHLIIVPLILFNLDVFMEAMIGNKEEKTGSKRGLYLSVMSLATSIPPLIAGYLMDGAANSFQPAYLAGAVLLIPFIYIITTSFKDFIDPPYHTLKVYGALRSFWKKKDLRNVFFAHFHLHIFFAWMTIYTPLYLFTKTDFTWFQIGLILFAGLIAYVFFEYPIGIIADKYIGEKEMMAFGFLVLAMTTSWLSFIDDTSVLEWMIVMFATRVGASFVETTTESYFFKHTQGDDTNAIS